MHKASSDSITGRVYQWLKSAVCISNNSGQQIHYWSISHFKITAEGKSKESGILLGGESDKQSMTKPVNHDELWICLLWSLEEDFISSGILPQQMSKSAIEMTVYLFCQALCPNSIVSSPITCCGIEQALTILILIGMGSRSNGKFCLSHALSAHGRLEACTQATKSINGCWGAHHWYQLGWIQMQQHSTLNEPMALLWWDLPWALFPWFYLIKTEVAGPFALTLNA